MTENFQFADLNIRYTGNKEKTINLVKRAIRMGYDAIAINIDVGLFFCPEVKNGDEPPSKKRKKKEVEKVSTPTLPEPFLVDESLLDLSSLERQGKKFRQYSRLTCDLTDSTSVFRLQQGLKNSKYDIVAVRPNSLDILNTVAKKGTFVDIITTDNSEGRICWLTKSKVLQSAAFEVGLTFEIIYSSALRDREARRNLITNSRLLLNVFTCGRGVIISSGAEDLSELRGPYDAMNMTVLFGINSKYARKFVSENSENVLKRCSSRKTMKCTYIEVPIENSEEVNRFKEVINIDELKKIELFNDQITS
uniref:Ribonuclease P protein subunit p30 n=1 Tax=Strongyloides papillosus TaxID=174720 RepID=A0A0N5BKP4_STREA